MVFFATLWLVIMALIPSGTAKDPPSTDQPLKIAIQEMQKANYYAFVMLLNMVPPEKLPSNITFLMPKNRMLAKTIIPRNDVLDFLLLHSIPAPLGFEYLKHLPTGSVIPSSEPELMLKVINKGRRSFFLNNAKLVSPNVCVAGSSIRCHGIDGVFLASNQTPPLPTTHPTPSITVTPPPLSPPPGGDTFHFTPTPPPQPPTDLSPALQNSGFSGSFAMSLKGYLYHWVVMLLILWC